MSTGIKDVARVANVSTATVSRVLAGFDREDWMDLVAGGLAIIEQPVEDMGRMAMTMLLDRLDHPDIPARKVVLNGVLRAASIAAPPPPSEPAP